MTTTSTRSIRRMLDDGGPLLVQGPAAQPIAIDALCCVNPRCGCREMDLYVWRIDRASEPGPAGADILATKLHIDTGALRVIGDAAPSNTGAPSIDEMRTALTPDLLEYLRGRWQRVKGRQNRQEWQIVDWSRIELDALVPFMEIFPSAWDLALMANRRRYWAVDCWCLTPGCTCAEIAVDFLEAEGGPVGMARLDVGAWAVIKADNDEAARLADRVVADSSVRRELRRRRTAVRGVARALPRLLESGRITPASYPVSGFSRSERCPASAETHSAESSRPWPERNRGPAPAHTADASIDTTHAPKVGRNTPCACGSGKKYKRCCGA